MKINKLNVILSIVVFLTILIVFLSYRYAVHVKKEEVQRAFYLFKQSVEEEETLMQPEQIFRGDSKAELRSDSVIIETEKGRVLYERNEQADSLALIDKREWSFQLFMTYKNPNRAFTLDSIYQEQLRDEGIIARTAVCFSQGDSLAGCSNEAVCRRGIALYPVVFGPKHDAKRIELQAYVLFSSSYLISRMPLIWGLILLWCIIVSMYIWQRRKKMDHKEFVNPATPIPVMISSDVSKGIEIAPNVFFNKKTGRLKGPNCEVCLTKNRLLAFICFLEAPDHTVSYLNFCKEVLKRPLNEEDELTEENKMLNRAIKKSMVQTIKRLREDLNAFPEFSIENDSGSFYRLNVKK